MSNRSSQSDQQRLEKGNYTDNEIASIHAQLAREKEEPSEGFSPIPIFLLFLFSGIIFWGGVYIAKPEHSAGFSADYFDHQEYRIRGGATPEGAGGTEPRAIDPARLYRNTCQVCHQPGGAGAGAFPPLANSDWVQGGEQRLIRVMLNGLTGPVTVNGKEYNSVMPGLGHQLSDEQIAAILTYIRSEWENNAPEVTVETVAAVRAEVGTRSEWTQAELDPYK